VTRHGTRLTQPLVKGGAVLRESPTANAGHSGRARSPADR
jgi:hypothetical protein